MLGPGACAAAAASSWAGMGRPGWGWNGSAAVSAGVQTLLRRWHALPDLLLCKSTVVAARRSICAQQDREGSNHGALARWHTAGAAQGSGHFVQFDLFPAPAVMRKQQIASVETLSAW